MDWAENSRRLLLRVVVRSLKPALLILVACLSLAAAGWGLGIYRQNSDHRRLYVDLWVPCVANEETLEVLVSSRLRASEKTFVDRANEALRHDPLRDARLDAASYERLTNPPDELKVAIRILDKAGLNKTREIMTRCGDELAIRTQPNASSYFLMASEPFITLKSKPSIKHEGARGFSMSDLYPVVGPVDAFEMYLNPVERLGEIRGASRVTLIQSAVVIPPEASRTNIHLSNVVEMALRFDDLRATSTSGAVRTILREEHNDIVDSVSYIFWGPNGSLMQAPQRSALSVFAIDNELKTVEDFVTLVAAAVFGFVLGAIAELSKKSRQSSEG